MDAEEKSTRETILTQVWSSYDKNEFYVTNLIQTKAEFSYAILVMDRVGGWIWEEAMKVKARLVEG